MNTNEKDDIKAVVQEFWQPKKGMTEAFTDAARLIIEARRERDEARAHAGYEQWRAEFDALRAERDVARDERDLLAALAKGETK